MSALSKVKAILANEDGAVTVDWIVLTAAVAGIGIACLGMARPGALQASSSILDDATANTSKNLTTFP